MTSAVWDAQDHHMGAAPDDDFGHFLDMSGMGDGMQFDFNGFQEDSAQSMMNRHRDQAGSIMGDSANSSMMQDTAGMMHDQSGNMSSAGGSGPGQMMASSGPGTDSISTIDAQIQYLQQQKFQQQQRQLQEQQNAYFSSHSHSVPPTPQSLELPPGSGHFYTHPEQMSHDVYDNRTYRQQRMKEQQDMAFTPLVSPAVTPLDPHFNMDNAFTVPGAYFSPLTSPALHAQNDSGSGYDQSGYNKSTQSNNSPVEMDLEAAPAPVATTLELSKKARKNNAAKSRSKAGVKSSPISKPQRKKGGPSPAIVSQVLSEVEERNHNQAADSNLLPLPATSTDGSEENASVSPENLTDMPPPPVPAWRSTSKSPYIQAQSGSGPASIPTTAPTPTSKPVLAAAPSNEQHANPATPASLMRLPASKSTRPAVNQHGQTTTDNIESLELPESVSKNNFTADTQTLPKDSPRIEPSSAKSTSSKPLPSPSLRRQSTASASQSPQIQPGSVGPSARKTPQIAPRTKKGSVQVSPALLPKISPSMKPLLPGSDSTESDASQLLMSKSNYQNILEGNTIAGVTYPSELSSNLTSKRTSHKIAEQGRRNRINQALQIMAGLLPDGNKNGFLDGEDSDKKDSKQQNASNSKASVVEKAILHMQRLEQENIGLKQEVQNLKNELEKLKVPS